MMQSQNIILTGSIGTGKSYASKVLKRLGYKSWDADLVTHQLISPNGKAFQKVIDHFPEGLKDGNIDRQTLGKIVFNDPAKLKLLESIIHPLVAEDRDHFIKWAHINHQKIVLEIPLYFETKMNLENFSIVVTSAPIFIQKMRVMRRKGMTEDKFQCILKRQMPDVEKCKKADFIIHTGLSYGETKRQITLMIKRLNQKNA
ncbi:MAG: dephospho-CoA kinase [Alphaproteobacteria bacterium]|nr:dephospho-CoA kinase [Alphaproteobacteria bacterium]